MVAHVKGRKGKNSLKEEMDFGPFGTLEGTDQQLAKYEQVLIRNGYRVEELLVAGKKKLHYTKEDWRDRTLKGSDAPRSRGKGSKAGTSEPGESIGRIARELETSS